jgi:molybdate transport system substrate-binding protein
VSRATLGALAVVLCGACAGSDTDALTVFAASSLGDVLEQIEPHARFNVAGSDELAAQLREGARADVFVSASVPLALSLHRDGVVERPRLLAANHVVVVVPRGNPARIDSLAALARPGVEVVIAEEGVPAGDYARESLASMDEGPAILANVVSEERDVRAVVGKVALGEADAGFAYRTDLAPYGGDAVEVGAIGALARADYAIAVVRRGERAAARAFVRRLLDPDGQRALLRAGFVTTSSAGRELP